MPAFHQDSFVGGEISQRLWGRTSLERYGVSLARARNVLIHPEGSVSRRPGTQWVPTLRSRSQTWRKSGTAARLVSFRHSNNQQYALVFRDRRMDVFKNGNVIVEDVVVPWRGEHLRFDYEEERPGIKFSQAGDFMVVTHPLYEPQLVVRVNDTTWEVRQLLREGLALSANSLAAAKTGGSENAADTDFSYRVIGVDRDGNVMEEVTSSRHAIAAVTLVDGLVNIRIDSPGSADLFRVGERVRVEGIDNPSDHPLNGGSFRISDVDYESGGSSTETVWTGWKTASSAASAQRAARAAIPAGYSFVKYETVNESTGSTTSRTFSDSRSVTTPGSSRGSEVSSAERSLCSSIQQTARDAGYSPGSCRFSSSYAGSRSSPTGNARTFRFCTSRGYSHQYSTSTLISNARNAAMSAGYTSIVSQTWSQYGSFRDGDDYRCGEVSARRVVSTHTWTVRASVTGYRTTGRSRYRARAQGRRTVSTRPETVTIELDTNFSNLPTWVSGGDVLKFGVDITAKRDASITLTWDNVSPEAARFDIYQKAEGGFGFVGETNGPEKRFTVQNKLGDETLTPPEFRDPFDSFPTCSALFQQRRVFGGFAEENRMEFSRVGLLDNFDIHDPPQDDDAISVILSASEINEIRHLHEAGELLFVMTGGAIWSLSGAGGVLAPTTVRLKIEQRYGSSHLPPLSVGDVVLHVSENGTRIHVTQFNFEVESYATRELSILFSHLLEDDRVVGWDIVEGHVQMLLAVLESGRVVAVSFRQEERLIAAVLWEFDVDGTPFDVSVKNTDGLDPIALLLVNVGGNTQVLRMQFGPGSLSGRFPADGVIRVGRFTDRPEGTEWLYRDDGTLIGVDAPHDPVDTDSGAWKGRAFEAEIHSLPEWSLENSVFAEAHVRTLGGRGVGVGQVIAGGLSDASALIGDGGETELPMGSHRVNIDCDPLRMLQFGLRQDHPTPFTLLGITAFDVMPGTGGARR